MKKINISIYLFIFGAISVFGQTGWVEEIFYDPIISKSLTPLEKMIFDETNIEKLDYLYRCILWNRYKFENKITDIEYTAKIYYNRIENPKDNSVFFSHYQNNVVNYYKIRIILYPIYQLHKTKTSELINSKRKDADYESFVRFIYYVLGMDVVNYYISIQKEISNNSILNDNNRLFLLSLLEQIFNSSISPGSSLNLQNYF